MVVIKVSAIKNGRAVRYESMNDAFWRALDSGVTFVSCDFKPGYRNRLDVLIPIGDKQVHFAYFAHASANNEQRR